MCAVKLLAVAFVWFLMQTCTEHQRGKFRPKIAIFFPVFTTKLEFCYLNFSKNIQLFKNMFVWRQSITFRLHKPCITFSRSSPDSSWGLSLKRSGGGTLLNKVENTTCLINYFFQLVFWFISKMTIYWYISSFADLLVLKTPRAIHPFLHGKPFAWYTYERFAFFVCFLFTAIFFRNDIIAPVLARSFVSFL